MFLTPMNSLSVKTVDNTRTYCYKIRHGAVAQLGEYLTGSQGVEGSIPFSSTIEINELRDTITLNTLQIVRFLYGSFFPHPHKNSWQILKVSTRLMDDKRCELFPSVVFIHNDRNHVYSCALRLLCHLCTSL
jgi:hypothetical protein